MSGLHDFQEVREHLRQLREDRERRRRRSWPFPPNEFVRASALLEADPASTEEASR